MTPRERRADLIAGAAELLFIVAAVAVLVAGSWAAVGAGL